MTYDEYSKIEGLNFSTVKYANKSARACKTAIDSSSDGTTSQALLRYQHAKILEPEHIDRDFAFWTGGLTAKGEATTNANSGAYKVMRAEAERAGKTLINTFAQAYADANSIAAATLADPWMAELLGDPATITELPVHGVDSITGERIKCRVDICNLDRLVWNDIKGYGMVAPKDVGRMVVRGLGVHQAAMNRRCFIAAGLTVPVDYYITSLDPKDGDLAVYRIPDYAMEHADETLTHWIQVVQQCRKTGEWPGVQPVEMRGEEMDFPPWAFEPTDTDAESVGLHYTSEDTDNA
jgi:hypothetical protein